MANERISDLSSGNPVQTTDLFVIARAGDNFSVTGAAIAALVPTPPTPTPETISAFPLPSVAQGVLWRSSATVNGYFQGATSGS